MEFGDGLKIIGEIVGLEEIELFASIWRVESVALRVWGVYIGFES